MNADKHRLDTKLIHAGEPQPRIHGAVALPIFQSVTFEQTGTSHRNLSPEEHQRIGIGDGLVRYSVGVEAAEDLIDDLDHALRA